MTQNEYNILQERFSAKLRNRYTYSSNRNEAYKDGVLACKSILKEIFEQSCKKRVENEL